MLRVPELKAGDQPFDPDFVQAMNPWVGGTGHSFGVGMGSFEGNDGKGAADPEERIKAMLNLAVVKEAVTKLHRDEDEQMRWLETFSSARICDIVSEHEKFLHNIMATGENTCKNEEQKNLFRRMTAAFVAQSRERALGLQYKKAGEYWREAVEEQNREFLTRALRPENLGNDAALTMYRDLIFYNMENMLGELPEKERKEKLDTAGEAFYRKVLEKRLEWDPEGAAAMVEVKEVRRVLGNDECAGIAEEAAAALRETEIEEKAGAWVRDGIGPKEAERLAGREFGEREEREFALQRYGQKRFEESRGIVNTTVANITSAWERLEEEGFDANALPGWIVRNEPALAECLRECLRRRENAGGGNWDVEYGDFLAFIEKFGQDGLREGMEHLRDEENCYSLILAAGGPKAEAWILCIRLLGGVLTDEDKEYISALQLAWGKGREREFMSRFVNELAGEEDKRALSVLELVRKVEESFPEEKKDNEE